MGFWKEIESGERKQGDFAEDYEGWESTGTDTPMSVPWSGTFYTGPATDTGEKGRNRDASSENPSRVVSHAQPVEAAASIAIKR